MLHIFVEILVNETIKDKLMIFENDPNLDSVYISVDGFSGSVRGYIAFSYSQVP